MTDQITSGQALVNSKTFWGAMLAFGSVAFPVLNQIVATNTFTPDQVYTLTTAGVAFLTTVYGRYKAEQPLTGVLKAN